jgi:hypothetical protein
VGLRPTTTRTTINHMRRDRNKYKARRINQPPSPEEGVAFSAARVLTAAASD